MQTVKKFDIFSDFYSKLDSKFIHFKDLYYLPHPLHEPIALAPNGLKFRSQFCSPKIVGRQVWRGHSVDGGFWQLTEQTNKNPNRNPKVSWQTGKIFAQGVLLRNRISITR